LIQRPDQIPELRFLLLGEAAKCSELTKSGKYEPKKLYLFVTYHPIHLAPQKHWTDKITERWSGAWRQFWGENSPRQDLEGFLLDGWNQGFIHWSTILSKQLGLTIAPLTTEGIWDYLHYRVNPLTTDPIPVPQQIVVEGTRVREEIYNEPHAATLLLQTEPKFSRGYVKIGSDYIGCLTFWDKPGGWDDERTQLSYLPEILDHDIVTDTDIIVQLRTGDDKKLTMKLNRLTKQGIAKARYREQMNDVDVAAKMKAQAGEEAIMKVMTGKVPIYVSCVFLVRRSSPEELDRATLFIEQLFKRPAWVVREQQIAWDIWRQTLPVVDENLLVSRASPLNTDRRMLYLLQEAMGFLPVIKTYSRDRRGLLLIAEVGATPIYLDLFSHGNAKHRHMLVLGATRSGKSVLVAQILTQALAHAIPVVAVDYPSATGESTYTAYTQFLGHNGAYFDISKQSINLFEIPNLYSFDEAERESRLRDFKEFLVNVLQAMVIMNTTDSLLQQTVRSFLTLALDKFFADPQITQRYEKALLAPFGHADRQEIPTLIDYFDYFKELDTEGFFKSTSNEKQTVAETLNQRAISQIFLRLEFWLTTLVGQAISKPSSVNTDALLTVLALTNVSDNEDAAILSLVAYAFCLRRAMESPLSLFFLDESPILFKFAAVRSMIEAIISNGAKAGIRCIISAQSPDKIATSSEGKQILSNINTKLIGKINQSAVPNICEVLGYSRPMVLRCAQQNFAINELSACSHWLVDDNGMLSYARYYPPLVQLALVANNQDEQLTRKQFERVYSDKYAAIHWFAKALQLAFRSNLTLEQAAAEYLIQEKINIKNSNRGIDDIVYQEK
jgi:hypothetical protein